MTKDMKPTSVPMPGHGRMVGPSRLTPPIQQIDLETPKDHPPPGDHINPIPLLNHVVNCLFRHTCNAFLNNTTLWMSLPNRTKVLSIFYFMLLTLFSNEDVQKSKRHQREGNANCLASAFIRVQRISFSWHKSSQIQNKIDSLFSQQ